MNESKSETMNDTLELRQSPSVAMAAFVAGLDLNSVPEDVVAYTRVLTLDLLGAALAGVDTEETRAMLSAAEGFAAMQGPCALWGTSRTTTAGAAALVHSPGIQGRRRSATESGRSSEHGRERRGRHRAHCAGHRPSVHQLRAARRG